MAIKISKGILLSMMETWVMLAFRAQDFHRLFQYLFPNNRCSSSIFSMFQSPLGTTGCFSFSGIFLAFLINAV